MNNLVTQIPISIKKIEKVKPKIYKLITVPEFFTLAIILSQKIKTNIAGNTLRNKVRLKNGSGFPNSGLLKNGKSVEVKLKKALFFISVGMKDKNKPMKTKNNNFPFEKFS